MQGMAPLGLIAGEGIFPILVARGAKAAGRRVVCVGLAGSARPELAAECDRFVWAGVTRMGKWIRTLRNAGCEQAIMVGRVQKAEMYSRSAILRYIPDVRTARMWFTHLRHDRRPYAMLKAVIDELDGAGITLIDSTTYTTEELTTAGVLTHREPSEAQWNDIRFGWELCNTISRLDIGQSIAVLNKDVIAVEAIEGTNAMIERAGTLCRRGGWTLIKVANSRQDMRVDVPTVGVTTIEKLAASGATCVVLQAGKTVLLERARVLELAEKHAIVIVGVDETGPQSVR